ncbi:odorant receptor 4-like [Diprion similis]|uniref:odorant receptor 4-like n=1 Tax=Diprion similis TaxID=362088 RepID=UPI001EF7F759|nr:odorant receptor 4-like [Diprion similis]
MSNSSSVVIMRDNNKFSDQFVTAIRALRCLMIYVGIWPEKKYEKLYNLLWYFHTTSLLFLICGLVCGLIKIRDDMDKVISNLSVTTGMIYVIGKWFAFSWHKELIKKLTNSMDEDWISLTNKSLIHGSVPDSKQIMLKRYEVLNIYVYTIFFVILIADMNFVVDYVAATNDYGNHTDLDNLLPVSYSWYPLDYNQGYIIQFLAVAQVSSLLSGLVANTVVDGFFFIAVLHTTGQLEILGNFIHKTEYNLLDSECVKKNVREMAKRHQLLLSVAADIQECYGMITFLHVTVSVICLCFSQYTFLLELQKTEGGRMLALKYGITSIAGLENIFIYCFVGDTLTSEGLAIGMSIYKSEWYNAGSSTNLSLSIMTAKAWKPIVLSAAKIFPLTMQSFTVIIKAIVSYLSALRALGVADV